MTINAAMIKELRARSGAGMLDCKNALAETGGDMDAAIAALRKKGVASAERKSGRTAAEGVIVAAGEVDASALVEINCETDFVAKDATFRQFARQVAAAVVAAKPQDLAAVAALTIGDGDTVETARQNLVAQIGENIHIRRLAIMRAGGGRIGVYLHGTRIGVLVRLCDNGNGGDAANDSLGKDVAMHIAAANPLCIDEHGMAAETLANERAIYLAQAEASGKPANIVEKMVDGRMRKFLQENTLLGQPFVKDPQQSVGQLVAATKATVEEMVRFEVGEGLTKREDNFVAEVLAQAGSAQ